MPSLVLNVKVLPYVSSPCVQDIIDGRLEKQSRGVYGPPAGKHMAVFVDDLNMPQVDLRLFNAWTSAHAHAACPWKQSK